MSIKDFQSFISGGDQQLLAASGSTVFRNVSLTDMGAVGGGGGKRGGGGGARERVALVLDGENCLDRLYGGYFPNWVCGGQWRHMMTFLANLFGRLHQTNVQVVVFLNGTLEPTRFREWVKQQKVSKTRAKNVMRHLATRGTPPPKAIWVAPCALHTMLRLALRTLNVTVINSQEDHRLEIMGFCWENGYHGVMSDDGEFALFNPPRYLSAHTLKLSLQLDVTSVEYDVDAVAKALDLNPNRFCLLATLLGNHILPAYELAEFHCRLAPEIKMKDKYKVGFERVIRAVINYIRALPVIDDYDVIAKDVFGNEKDPRISKVKESVKYFLHGTKDGYTKHFANPEKVKKKSNSKKTNEMIAGRVITSGSIRLPADVQAEEQKRRQQLKQQRRAAAAAAAAAAASEQEGKNGGGGRNEAEIAERIALDLERLDLHEVVARAAGDFNQKVKNGEAVEEDDNEVDDDDENGHDVDDDGEVADYDDRDQNGGEGASDPDNEDSGTGGGGNSRDDNETSSDGKPMSVVQALASGVEVAPSGGGKYPGKEKGGKNKNGVSVSNEPLRPICIPDAPHEVKRTAAERHRLAQMSPYVNQVLNKGEIKLPVLLEGDNFSQLPPAHEIFKPLRQNVYAILFNLHHARYTRKTMEEVSRKHVKEAKELQKEAQAEDLTEEQRGKLVERLEKVQKQMSDMKVPPKIEYTVREWHPYDGYDRPWCVDAQELRWAVPTVQRLWFGSTVEDKQKRLHAFMSIMRCDAAESMLLQANVPQPMLLMACVLRYIITASQQQGNNSQPIIRKPELDAFLVTAFSPELRNDALLDDLTLENVTMRGVRLGVLFMQGIEMALFANDACGAPIPFQMCLPWMFFDGKLFHTNLMRVSKARNVLDLCGGRIDIVNQVERMRNAIMEGLMPHQHGGGGGGLAAAATANAHAVAAAQAAAQQQHMMQRGGYAAARNLYQGRDGGGASGGGNFGQKNRNRGGKKKKNKNKENKPNQEQKAAENPSGTAISTTNE